MTARTYKHGRRADYGNGIGHCLDLARGYRLGQIVDGCVEWPFCRTNEGYGLTAFDGRKFTAARLTLMFAKPLGRIPERRDQCRHLCGNRACHNPAHLAWGTQSDNEHDKAARGTSAHGERNASCKLADGDVLAIRRMLADGTPVADLAALFRVGQTTIYDVASGRRLTTEEGVTRSLERLAAVPMGGAA